MNAARCDLEICLENIDDAVAAAAAGADRIELCAGLIEGGTTPSSGMITATRAATPVELSVMIRPRGGDFVYTARELDVMFADVEGAREAGADGVVFGVLTTHAEIDAARTALLVERARPLRVTIHRAFDLAGDLTRALDEIIALGVDRVLTSGGEATAAAGAERIAELVQLAAGRIVVMAGAGVRASGVRALVERTGVGAVHGSARTMLPSAMRLDPRVLLARGGVADATRAVTDPREVQAMRRALDEIAITIPGVDA